MWQVVRRKERVKMAACKGGGKKQAVCMCVDSQAQKCSVCVQKAQGTWHNGGTVIREPLSVPATSKCSQNCVPTARHRHNLPCFVMPNECSSPSSCSLLPAYSPFLFLSLSFLPPSSTSQPPPPLGCLSAFLPSSSQSSSLPPSSEFSGTM